MGNSRPETDQSGAGTGGPRPPVLDPLPLGGGAKLRAMINEPGMILAPQAYSPEMAAIAEDAGHKCVYVGGGGTMARLFMFDDWGLMNPSEMADIAGRTAAGVSIPVIADMDQGGETPLNTYLTVKEYIRRGVAGAHIEDTLNPKHMAINAAANRHTAPTNRVLSIDEMQVRVEAAVAARKSAGADFIIIARTDVLENTQDSDNATREEALAETIRRGNAYAEAGSDVFMPDDATLQQTIAVMDGIPIPVLNHGTSDRVKVSDFRKTKLKICINLYEPPILLGVMEAMMRYFYETEDNTYVGLNLPGRLKYVQRDHNIDQEDLRKLGLAWAAARDRMTAYAPDGKADKARIG